MHPSCQTLGVTTRMTSRSLLVAITLFSVLAVVYVAAYLTVLRPYQNSLRDVHAIGLSVPAAALAFFFQLRLSRIARLDAWAKEYTLLLKELAEWLERPQEQAYTREDCIKVARFTAQAEGLSAALKSTKVAFDPKAIGSIEALAFDLDQQTGCPPGYSRNHELVELFERSMYNHIRGAPSFVVSLYV